MKCLALRNALNVTGRSTHHGNFPVAGGWFSLTIQAGSYIRSWYAVGAKSSGRPIAARCNELTFSSPIPARLARRRSCGVAAAPAVLPTHQESGPFNLTMMTS
jgi:hypothetical protein